MIRHYRLSGIVPGGLLLYFHLATLLWTGTEKSTRRTYLNQNNATIRKTVRMVNSAFDQTNCEPASVSILWNPICGSVLHFAGIWLGLVAGTWLLISQLPIRDPSYLIYVVALLAMLPAGRLASFLHASFGDVPKSPNRARRELLKTSLNVGAIGVVAKSVYSYLPYNPLHQAPPELYLPDKLAVKMVQFHTFQDFELLSDTETPLDVLVLINAAKRYTTSAQVEMAKAVRRNTKLLVVVDHHDAAYETWTAFTNAGISNLNERLRFILTSRFRDAGSDMLSQWAQDAINVLYNRHTQEFTVAELPPLLRRSPPFTVAYNIMGHQMAGKDIPWMRVVKNEFGTLPILGGEMTSDDQFVYLTNTQNDIRKVEAFTKREAIVLPNVDTSHTDLFHVPIGETAYGKHTSLLPDAVAYFEIVRSLSHAEKKEAIREINRLAPVAPLPLTSQRGLIDYRDVWNLMLNADGERMAAIKQSAFVQKLNRAEQILAEKGIAVFRVPGIPLKDKTIAAVPFGIYPTNVVQDVVLDDFGRIVRSVFIPKYGIKKLDDAIRKAYADVGVFQSIHAIPAVDEGLRWGGVRCRCKKIGVPII